MADDYTGVYAVVALMIVAIVVVVGMYLYSPKRVAPTTDSVSSPQEGQDEDAEDEETTYGWSDYFHTDNTYVDDDTYSNWNPWNYDDDSDNAVKAVTPSPHNSQIVFINGVRYYSDRVTPFALPSTYSGCVNGWEYQQAGYEGKRRLWKLAQRRKRVCIQKVKNAEIQAAAKAKIESDKRRQQLAAAENYDFKNYDAIGTDIANEAEANGKQTRSNEDEVKQTGKDLEAEARKNVEQQQKRDAAAAESKAAADKKAQADAKKAEAEEAAAESKRKSDEAAADAKAAADAEKAKAEAEEAAAESKRKSDEAAADAKSEADAKKAEAGKSDLFLVP